MNTRHASGDVKGPSAMDAMPMGKLPWYPHGTPQCNQSWVLLVTAIIVTWLLPPQLAQGSLCRPALCWMLSPKETLLLLAAKQGAVSANISLALRVLPWSPPESNDGTREQGMRTTTGTREWGTMARENKTLTSLKQKTLEYFRRAPIPNHDLTVNLILNCRCRLFFLKQVKISLIY